MISSNEFDSILDFPNQFDLDFESNKKNKEVCNNSSVQTISDSDKCFSTNTCFQMSSQKVKTKVERILTDSEIYVKILKNVKTALRTVEEEKNNKINFNSNNQSLLEKIKIYPLGGKNGNFSNAEQDEVINYSTKNDENKLKRKYTEAFGNDDSEDLKNISVPPNKKFKYNITSQPSIENFFKIK